MAARRSLVLETCMEYVGHGVQRPSNPYFATKFFPASLTLGEEEGLAWCRVGKVATTAWSASTGTTSQLCDVEFFAFEFRKRIELGFGQDFVDLGIAFLIQLDHFFESAAATARLEQFAGLRTVVIGNCGDLVRLFLGDGQCFDDFRIRIGSGSLVLPVDLL